MPITKSAKKALRQSFRRKAQNLVVKDEMKKTVKKFRELNAKKQFDEAKALLSNLYKSLDKAAKKGLIKKNAASRKKSRLTKLLAKGLK